MTNKTLEQRITELELKAIGYDKHDSYGSEVMETAKEALEIIAELTSANKQKPCEYIHQGGDNKTSYCKLAASHGKELEEWQPIETYKGGKALFYYPPLYSDKIGKPNKISHQQLVSTDLLYRRNPTHWMPLPKPPTK